MSFPQGPDQPIISTSVCEVLAHPERFQEKVVTMRVRYSGTWEGFYLSDASCKGDENQGTDLIYVATPSDPTLPREYTVSANKNAEWQGFYNAAKHICNGLEIEKCYYDYVSADFSGLVIVKSDFRVKGGFGNGFGHLRLSKVALIPQMISNVVPHRQTRNGT